MTMELDEMKQAWQVLDRRLAEQATLYRAIHRGQGMDRLRRGLRPLVWGQSVQIAFGVFFLLFGIDFWVTHMGTLRTIVWGTSVQAFGVLMIASAGRILHLVQQIDYALPVVDIQRRLARLRAWRVRVEAPVFAAVGAVIWIPLVLIWIQLDWDRLGSHGPDFWEQTPYLLPHFLTSAFVSLVLVIGTYFLLLRLGRSRWLQDNFAGSAVRRAEAALAEVASFEQE
jgi:hypothetical protein